MNEQSLLSPVVTEKPRFWRRQFNAAITRKQVIFDVIFGILLPAICFFFDPIVFHGWLAPNGGILRAYTLLAYFSSAIAVLVLIMWLALGKRLGAWSSLVGGVLLAGASLSFLIGCLILPFSLMGIFFLLIGVLGFVPFFTAFVYLRNAVRCLRQAKENSGKQKLIGFAVTGAVLLIGIPSAMQWQVNGVVSESIEQIRQNGTPPSTITLQSLRYLNWCIDATEFVRAYEMENDPVRKDQLSATYKKLTGESIEWRLAVLND